jgi:hypothetical protein
METPERSLRKPSHIVTLTACSLDPISQNQSVIQQYFSLTTNQYQPKSATQKPSSERGRSKTTIRSKQYAIRKWWNVLNAVNAGEKLLLTSEITSFVRYMATEACWRGESVSNPIVATCGWSPPPDADGLLKINIDGAFIPASRMRAGASLYVTTEV